MAVRLSVKNLDKLQTLLKALRDSCYEGLEGDWDCSTDEGREGFGDMADVCDEIAEILNLKIN